jgi:hypothetical protein
VTLCVTTMNTVRDALNIFKFMVSRWLAQNNLFEPVLFMSTAKPFTDVLINFSLPNSSGICLKSVVPSCIHHFTTLCAVLGEETNLADQSYQYLTTGEDMRGFHDDTTGQAKVSLLCRFFF